MCPDSQYLFQDADYDLKQPLTTLFAETLGSGAVLGYCGALIIQSDIPTHSGEMA